MGFPINCDTRHYLIIEQDPSILMAKNEPRQSRPLYVLLCNTIGVPIQWILEKTGLSSKIKFTGRTDLAGFFVANILLNFVILLLALLLFYDFVHRLSPGLNETVIYLLSVFMTSNIVVKVFFWSATMYMFTLLSPLLCLFIMIKINKRTLTMIEILGLCFLLRILPLFYGNFLLILPMVLYVVYYKNFKYAVVKTLAKAALTTFVFILPTFLWIFLLRLNHITYYNHDVVIFRMMVWGFDDLKLPFRDGLKDVMMHFMYYFITLRSVVFVLSGVIILHALLLIKKIQLPISGSKYFEYLVVMIIGAFAFYFMIGFYKVHYSYALVPLLLVYASFEISLLPKSKWIVLVLSAIVIAWHIGMSIMHGPYSS